MRAVERAKRSARRARPHHVRPERGAAEAQPKGCPAKRCRQTAGAIGALFYVAQSVKRAPRRLRAAASLLRASAYGGGRGGVGLASDTRHFPQVRAKQRTKRKCARNAAMPDGASSGDCAVPQPAGAGRVHEPFDSSPLLPASTRCARRGEFSDDHCALRTPAAARYFEIATFMATFM